MERHIDSFPGIRPHPAGVNGLFYDDLQTFIEDQTHLVKNKSCNYLEGHIVKLGLDPALDELSSVTKKDWCYMIEAVLYDEETLDKLPFDQSLRPLLKKDKEITYKDFANRMDHTEEFLKKQGSWTQQHPWINLFLPSDQIFNVVNDMMKTISLEDTGGWPILMYPISKSAISCEYFQTPESAIQTSESEIIWMLAILRNSPDQQTTEKLIEKNRLLYGHINKIGGKMYPIGAIPMEGSDWENHFGTKWKDFKQLKHEADPYHLLGRGQGIFKHPK